MNNTAAPLTAEASISFEELQTLYTVGQRLTASTSPDDLLINLLKALPNGETATANLFFVDIDQDARPEWLEQAALVVPGFTPYGALNGTRYFIPDFPIGQFTTSNPNNVLFIEDSAQPHPVMDDATRAIFQQYGARGVVVLPLAQTERGWVGTVSVFWADPHTFTAQEQRLYTQMQSLLSSVVLNLRQARDLKKSEEQYKRIIDTALEGIWQIDTTLKTTYANQRLAEIFGYRSAEDMMGLTPLDLMDEANRINAESHFGAALTGAAQKFDQLFKRKDGTDIWLLVSSNTMYDDKGEAIGFLALVNDITDRKAAEEAQARLAAIVANTSDYVGSATLDGRSFYMNAAANSIWGLSDDTDLSQYTIDQFSPAWANEKIGKEGIPAAMQNGTWNGETAILDKDGNEIPVSQTIITHKNPDGSPAFLSTIIRDISEQKRAAAEREKLIKDLQAARRIAEENSRLKSEFLSTMSHELRTPLNAIEGFTSIMLSKMGGAEYNEKTERYISRVNTNSKRLLALINDFLDLSRIESGRLELVNQPFSPSKLAHKWQDEIGVLAERKGLNFLVVVDENLPEMIMGDEESISKIAINLLGNAMKFTEKGEVRLMLVYEQKEWSIIVADTGIGIPPHAREYIFDEFRQVDQTSKRKYGGTGLGLAIAQKLARSMGGTITLTSELGQGSIFTVTLPLKVAE